MSLAGTTLLCDILRFAHFDDCPVFTHPFLRHPVKCWSLASLRLQELGLIDVYRRGLIEAIGFDSDIKAAYHSTTFDDIIDATNKCIIPGRKYLCMFQTPLYVVF